LNEFKEAILPVFNFLKSQEIQKAKGRKQVLETKEEFKLRRTRQKGLIRIVFRNYLSRTKKEVPGGEGTVIEGDSNRGKGREESRLPSGGGSRTG
jgi:hypothetical protein